MSKALNRIIALMLAILLCGSQDIPVAFAETDVSTGIEDAVDTTKSDCGITILSQPVSKEPESNVVEFKVEAVADSGSSEISYQWQSLCAIEYETEEARAAAWENIPDANGNVLRLGEEELNSGAYDNVLLRCIVSAETEGVYSSVFSDEVTIVNLHEQARDIEDSAVPDSDVTTTENVLQPESTPSDDTGDSENGQNPATDVDEQTELGLSDENDVSGAAIPVPETEVVDDSENENSTAFDTADDEEQYFSFTINFDKNSTAAKGTMSSLNGSTADEPLLPECNFCLTGKKLAYWADSVDASGKTYAPGTPVRDLIGYDGQTVTLYAVWEDIEYTVLFTADGETVGSAELSYTEKLTVTDLSITKPGYHVKEWHYKTGNKDKTALLGDSVAKLSSVDGKVIEFEAVWAVNKYKLRYDGNTATSGSVESLKFAYNKGITLASSGYKKPGYVLRGWSLAPEEPTAEYSFDYKVGAKLSAAQVKELAAAYPHNSIITLYAVWGPKEYKINYNNLSTAATNENPKTYNTLTGVAQLQSADDPGYTFDGWYTDSNYKNSIKAVPEGSRGELTLYAKKTANIYTVEYNLDGGQLKVGETNPESYQINKSNPLKNPTKKGYIFAGWYDQNGKKIANLKGKYGDKVLTAKWNPVEYKVTFYSKDGVNAGTTGLKMTVACRYDEAFNALPEKTFIRNGYYLIGWNTNSKGNGTMYAPGEELINLRCTEGKVTLYAIWSKTPDVGFSITFDANGGTGEMQPVVRTSAETLPACRFTMEGMYFAGWRIENAGDLIPDCAEVSLLGDGSKELTPITLVAQWEEQTAVYEHSAMYRSLFGTDSSEINPQMAGHKGLKNLMPENTIPSFKLASEVGLAECETDVRLTKDGVIVCMHDATIDRTTNGKGYVKDLTYAQLQKYYVDIEPQNGLKPDELRVPTLEEYIIVCRDAGMICQIELKEDLGHEVLELLRKYGMENQALITSNKLSYLLPLRDESDIWLHWIANTTNFNNVDKIAGIGNISLSFNYKKVTSVPANLQQYCAERGVYYCFRGGNTFEDYRWQQEKGSLFFTTNQLTPADIDAGYASING